MRRMLDHPPVKTPGFCGSPMSGVNVEELPCAFLRGRESVPRVEWELPSLAGLRFEHCVHCSWCLRKQGEGRRCSRDDLGIRAGKRALEAPQ